MRARTPRNQFGVYLVSSVVSQLVCCIFATRQPLVAQNVSTLTPLVSRASVCKRVRLWARVCYGVYYSVSWYSVGTVGGIYILPRGGGKLADGGDRSGELTARWQSCRVRDRRRNRDSDSESVALRRSRWNVVAPASSLRFLLVTFRFTCSFSRGSKSAVNGGVTRWWIRRTIVYAHRVIGGMQCCR